MKETKAFIELKQVLDEYLNTGRELSELLNQQQVRVIRLRYGLDNGKCLDLKEIGMELKVTQERVRQILFKSHRILKKKLDSPNRPILSIRAEKVLSNLGITNLEDLANYSKRDAYRFRNCGYKTLAELESHLLKQSKSFKKD